MAIQNDGDVRTFVAGEALLAYRAVELTALNTVSYPNALADRVIGITQAAAASGAHVPVKLANSGGTFKVTVDSATTGATAGGTALYVTTSAGKLSPTDGGSAGLWFYAIENGSGDGSVIEAVAKVG